MSEQPSTAISLEFKDWIGTKCGEAFTEECLAATTCPSVFDTFRQLPGMLSIVENKTDKAAYVAWQSLRRACPWLLEKGDAIAANDSIGGPRTISVDEINHNLAPATMCFAADYAALRWCFGSLNGMRIAEIGGGYGGLASLVTRLSDVKSYTIYDLPEATCLQKKYLDRLGCQGIQYLTQIDSHKEEDEDGLLKEPAEHYAYDLLIACDSFSELSLPLQAKYTRHVLRQSARGWIVWGSRVQPGHTLPVTTQRVTDELTNLLAPVPVHCGRDLIEYREIFRDRSTVTNMWGGCIPNLMNQPWKATDGQA